MTRLGARLGWNANVYFGVLVILGCWRAGSTAADAPTERPNIVYILADDLGIGDVRACNPDGKIATPYLDRIAAEGMRFTDAHSGSAVCTPTRYGLLTGRYAWRTRLESGVCWGYSLPLIDAGRMTAASLLKEHGYHTACIGKWHLGLKWALKDPKDLPDDNPSETWENIDFSLPIAEGPNQVGFDYYYGISASLDMHPHVFIENDRVTRIPDRIDPGSDGMKFWRKGPIAEGFQHIEVLDQLTDKAVEVISRQTSDRPFFLYFPLPAPHKPIIPNASFQGKSGLNAWGDFVMQVDWTVGQVMEALDSTGLANNTLLIVTSDNGATPGADFDALGAMGHDPSFVYRGHKADIFEGGHRVAFLARWPGVVAPGSTSDATICHTDLLATVAEILSTTLPDNAGEDSVSILPLLNGTAAGTVRAATVHHSSNGSYAIRRGNWKLCLCPGSGGWSDPRPARAQKLELPAVQLYDLSTDAGETENVHCEHPNVVHELSALLERFVDQGRSTPGAPQSNDRVVKVGRD